MKVRNAHECIGVQRRSEIYQEVTVQDGMKHLSQLDNFHYIF